MLPASGVGADDDDLQKHWDYIYEPDAGELLEDVLMRYIESQVYRGAVENFACEMAAKMVAMKSATDNAGDIIDELQLQYNKARQAAITQEISEIVGGAAAVSRQNFKRMISLNLEMSTGTTVQVIGAVVDVEFPAGQIPKIYDALIIDDAEITLEVQQQLGDGVVRTIAMGSSEGLKRGMAVTNTGSAITVPVGEKTLGRIMDVLGQANRQCGPHWRRSTHADSPRGPFLRRAGGDHRASGNGH